MQNIKLFSFLVKSESENLLLLLTCQHLAAIKSQFLVADSIYERGQTFIE